MCTPHNTHTHTLSTYLALLAIAAVLDTNQSLLGQGDSDVAALEDNVAKLAANLVNLVQHLEAHNLANDELAQVLAGVPCPCLMAQHTMLVHMG